MFYASLLDEVGKEGLFEGIPCRDEFCSVIGLDFSWIDLVVLEVLEQSTGEDRGVDEALFVCQAYKQSACFDGSGTILKHREFATCFVVLFQVVGDIAQMFDIDLICSKGRSFFFHWQTSFFLLHFRVRLFMRLCFFQIV